MTAHAPVARLMDLGYTEREAGFLHLVATHSGYFLRRHFLKFAGVARGGTADALIQKALERRHIRQEPHTPRGGLRYQLYSRPLYTLLGKENSSNRKRHPVQTINVRLHALDFVLDNPDAYYLEEEPDKLAHFEAVLKIARDALPTKVYKAWNSSEPPCTRYFVDKFPLFVAQDGMMTFTYVDHLLQTLQPFHTHLLQYRRLFDAMPGPFRLVFVSPTDTKFSPAERMFRGALTRDSAAGADAEMLRYFDIRRRFEAKELRGFSNETFRARIEGARKYSSPEHEELYSFWLRSPQALQAKSTATPRTIHAEFGKHRVAV